MEKRQNKAKDTVVILLAWFIAIALVYLVYLKFRLLYH